MAQEDALPAVAMTFSICTLFYCRFPRKWIFLVRKCAQLMDNAVYGDYVYKRSVFIVFKWTTKISSSTAVTLSLAEPLTAAILGVFLIGEHLSIVSWLGVAMLLGGIVVLTLGGRKS